MSSSASDPAREFRDAIGRFATGVTIVTAIGEHGPAGMTTNAVASLSLEPRLLLVCFAQGSRTLEVVRAAGRFAVNVLRAGDEELAAVFASRRVGPAKFEAATRHAWSERHGAPVLDGALAWMACELRELRPGGDHEIGIGEVVATGAVPGGEPLVFFGGRYTSLAG